MLSIFDIFKIGVGPSSSHTMGPMVIARRFMESCEAQGCFDKITKLRVELYGSLALTGIGHGTDWAVYLGLIGQTPETLSLNKDDVIASIKSTKKIKLLNQKEISFDPSTDISFLGDHMPKLHSNGMRLIAYDRGNTELLAENYYSIGGGFVCREDEFGKNALTGHLAIPAKYPYESAAELLAHAEKLNCPIHEVILRNEDLIRPRMETFAMVGNIWRAMHGCINRGLNQSGILPGGLNVKRRAPEIYDKLARGGMNEREALLDWLNVFALAVNEENAAGSQVVTAPTNGAAGIIPAVLKFYCANDGVTEMEKIRIFLTTAAGIGILYKKNASISGAEMGCQGEVGVACSMAAAGLAAIWGGTPRQVEHAAEIGMEHNLGLTCDPVGGLVQIPCIERNAIGTVKAVNAARMAIQGDGSHIVTLDQVIETMRMTGEDMNARYKETSKGGLAVNVVEC